MTDSKRTRRARTFVGSVRVHGFAQQVVERPGVHERVTGHLGHLDRATEQIASLCPTGWNIGQRCAEIDQRAWRHVAGVVERGQRLIGPEPGSDHPARADGYTDDDVEKRLSAWKRNAFCAPG